jgi:polysaccharide deacetylase 2 family uncharacterized protein YibQ
MAADTHDDSPSADGRGLNALALAWLTVFAVLLLLLASIAFFGRASDGDPVVSLELTTPTAPKAAPTKGSARRPSSETNLIGAGPQPVAPPEPAAGAALPPMQSVPSKIDSPLYAGAALVADPGLIEQTAAGPLPRIGDNGRTPMAAYAPPVAAAKSRRIALVVSGLGVSAKATAAAIAGLPPAVTLAFAPYASDVQRWVSEARRRGHEVLLEVPMEPYDFPDSDPGPHTLRIGAPEDANIERLTWAMTRFSGYAGVTNLLGGRFLADADSLEPVMSFVSRRGLLFFDSGGGGRSAVPEVASRLGAPFAESAVTIDAIQTGMEIDQRLSELETRARMSGTAAGTGFLYPVTVERIAAWAEGLGGRGFVLVPASAIVAPGK